MCSEAKKYIRFACGGAIVLDTAVIFCYNI